MKKILLSIFSLILILSCSLAIACNPTTGVDTGAKVKELENKCTEIKTWLNGEVPTDISGNITLPDTHPTLGGGITWQSSNTNIISTSGVFNKPEQQTPVILTATIKLTFQELDKTVEPIDVESTWTKTVNTLSDDIPTILNSIVASLGRTLPLAPYANDQVLPTENPYGAYIEWETSKFTTTKDGANWKLLYPQIMPDYTTPITLTAYIRLNDKEYIRTFERYVQGKVNLPSNQAFTDTLNSVWSNEKLNQTNIANNKKFVDDYMLPGKITLDKQRDSANISLIENIYIRWTISNGDARGFDVNKNKFVRLSFDNEITLRAEFVFQDAVLYSGFVTRTIPKAESDVMREYLENYIKSFVPNVIGGDILLPLSENLYDFTFDWVTDSENVILKGTQEYNGENYRIIGISEAATYLEKARLNLVNVKQRGSNYTFSNNIYPVLLCGKGENIVEMIPDDNLRAILKSIFSPRLALESTHFNSPETWRRINFELDLSKEKVDRVTGNNFGITNLKGIERLLDLKWLNLSGNTIESGLEYLSSLVNLEILNLSNCGLTSINNSTFASMKFLEGLDLSYNSLKNIDFLANETTQYKYLTDLLLQGNNISNINALMIKEEGKADKALAPRLGQLLLNNNKISDIDALSLNVNIIKLWLSDNQIIDISALKNMNLLKILVLSNNKIGYDENGKDNKKALQPLERLISLKELHLSDNNISDIRYLNRLNNLETLTLANNNIDGTSYLSNKINLKHLDLDGNRITTIGDFMDLIHLEKLFLENNQITEVLPNDLTNLVNLVELRLNGNNFGGSDFASTIGKLTALKYLSLNGSDVQRLDFLKDLTNLVHLELSNTNLVQNYETKVEVVDEETGAKTTKSEYVDNLAILNTLRKLEVLDISNMPNKGGIFNQITDISALQNLNNLKTFYADNNKLENYSSALAQMRRVVNLSLQNCSVSNINWINSMSNLEYANLSGNGIIEINGSLFANKIKIKYLYLDSVNDASIINIAGLTNFEQIKALSLANIKFESLEEFFFVYFDNLEYLNLSNTGIITLDEITNFGNLQALDLSHNAITASELDILLELNNLEYLWFYKTYLNENLTWCYNNKNNFSIFVDDTSTRWVASENQIKILESALGNAAKTQFKGLTVKGDNPNYINIDANFTGLTVPKNVNGFDIVWTTNNTNFVWKNGQIICLDSSKLIKDKSFILKGSTGLVSISLNFEIEIWYTINDITVSFKTNGGTLDGRNDPSFAYIFGTNMSKPNNPVRNGYKFVGWYTDSSLSKVATFPITLSTNITFYAKWEMIIYTSLADLINNINDSSRSVFTVALTNSTENNNKTIIIPAHVEVLNITGVKNITFTSVSFEAAYRTTKLVLNFTDFSFAAPIYVAATAIICNGDLELNITGTCKIYGGNGNQGQSGGIGIKANNLTIIGSGELEVTGGEGGYGYISGNGYTGGNGITCKALYVNISKFTVKGGKGGSGGSANTSKAGNGGTGGNGIYCTSKTISGSVDVQGGKGGDRGLATNSEGHSQPAYYGNSGSDGNAWQ